jgi:uncharacterized protein YecE (DUF72 family)
MFSVANSGDTVIAPRVTGLYVGTSGWSYPKWKPGFYPAGTDSKAFLSYYAERFRTVELNTTGYRLPGEEQFRRWAEQTPAGFRFSVKLPGNRPQIVAEFSERARALGDRLGPVRVVLTNARDEGMLALLLGSLDPKLRLAFDLQHESWDGVEPQLAAAGAVRVNDLEHEAPFRYLRFREPPYDEAQLATAAAEILPLLADGEVYAYFRHEDEPQAPAYAARLAELVADTVSE